MIISLFVHLIIEFHRHYIQSLENEDGNDNLSSSDSDN